MVAARSPLAFGGPALVLACCLILATGPGGRAQETAVAPDSEAGGAPQPPASLPIIETEVVALTLKGQRGFQRLFIPDLDVLPRPDGRRSLPLIRLLAAMGIAVTREGGQLSFRMDGGPPQLVDGRRQCVATAAGPRPVELVAGVSDLTRQEEWFLPADEIEALLGISLAWDDGAYAFVAATAHSLPIWQLAARPSLLAVAAAEIREELPERLPPASPPPTAWSLDMLELRGRARALAVNRDAPRELALDSLEQSLWGAAGSGRYKLRFSETPVTWREGEGLDDGHDAFVRMDWAEWGDASASGAVRAGDSLFGISELTFPTLRLFGMQGSRLAQLGPRPVRWRGPQAAGRTALLRPHVVEELVPVGSRVALEVNGQTVDSDLVAASLPGLPGTGLYRFEEVQLTPGSLNQIRLRIIDANGIETVIERQVLGSSAMLPAQGLAMVAGAGSSRTPADWHSRGLAGGGRLLYGLHERLTVGLAAAGQSGFWKPVTLTGTGAEERQYPKASRHAGGQLIAQPADWTMLAAELSIVESEADPAGGRAKDVGLKTDLALCPWEEATFSGLYFRYGPDFFDGQHRSLFDREGFDLTAAVRPSPWWEGEAAWAQAWNNLDGARAETLSVDLQRAAVKSRALPRSTVALAIERLHPSWGERDRSLVSVDLASAPVQDLSLKAFHAWGDDLLLDEHPDFLDPLRLPGFALSQSRYTTLSLSRYLPGMGTLAASYWDTGLRERASVIHTTGSFFGLPIASRTEIGYELDRDQVFFENRSEYPLDATGRSRLGLRARFQENAWVVEIFVNLQRLLARQEGRLRDVTARRLNPEQSLIAGQVFVDANADALPDPGEQGISGIKLFLNDRASVTSDEAGLFLFQPPANLRQARVTLDADTVPATFAVVNGSQLAQVEPGRTTRVLLAVTPVHVVEGLVQSQAPADPEPAPLAGVRVQAAAVPGEATAAESVTASDGSYFLQGLRPGRYRIALDPSTLPPGLSWDEAAQEVVIPPTQAPQERQLAPFVAKPATGAASAP
ncbi:MAG: hypothetical protein AB1634_14005 [Thermodesulfobacteriota bacterium]